MITSKRPVKRYAKEENTLCVVCDPTGEWPIGASFPLTSIQSDITVGGVWKDGTVFATGRIYVVRRGKLVEVER